MRNAQLQREPAGRFTVGGSGVASAFERRRSGTGASSLGERQLARGSVIIKNFGVAAPLDGGFELPAGFVPPKRLVKPDAGKRLLPERIRFGCQGLLPTAQLRNVVAVGVAH